LSSLPRISVFGLGAYYQKLRSAIWKHFDVVLLADVQEASQLSLMPEEQARFRQIGSRERPSTIVPASSSASLVLTPNRFHAAHIEDLVAAGQLVFVEKPCVISMTELENVEQVLAKHPQVYFSDLYLDVKSAHLLWLCDALPETDWRVHLIRGIGEVPPSVQHRTHWPPQRIEGRILEMDSIFRNDWLADPCEGGVLFDLMVHLLAVLHALFPHDELEITRSVLRDVTGATLEKVGDHVECDAEIAGTLSPSGTEVLFQVAKNAPTQCRELVLYAGPHIYELAFTANNPLTIHIGDKNLELTLAGDSYELVIRSFAAWLNKRQPLPYGWSWNKSAVETILQVKAKYSPFADSK
jgi:predicted dehydrogenase